MLWLLKEPFLFCSFTAVETRSTTPNTDGPSETLPLFFPKPPSLISAFRTLLEQIVLSSLSARITVGFERLVSRAILLSEICIAQRNIRCSQVLNGILDPSKKEPDLIESHVRHRLLVQRHMYRSTLERLGDPKLSVKRIALHWRMPSIPRGPC